MAQQNRVTLKGYFERGDRPTQQQFADLVDSVPNIQDGEPGFPKSDYSAPYDPDSSFDNTQGWKQGSEIFTIGRKLWKCVSNTTNNADWILLYPQSGTPTVPNNSMVNDNNDLLANDDRSILIND